MEEVDMTQAPRKVLDSLHARLTETLDTALTAEELNLKAHSTLLSSALTEDDVPGLTEAINSSRRADTTLMRVIAGFLKDNEVTAEPIVDGSEETLAERLERMASKRRVGDTPHTMN